MLTSVKIEVRECHQPGDWAVPELPPDVVNVWVRSLHVPASVERAYYELLHVE
jgi:hypothetical protein